MTAGSSEESNPWRETVRDIYDEVLVRQGHTAVGRMILGMICERHPVYFGCEGVGVVERKDGHE